MRILILDDEKKSREVLKALIGLYCENIEDIALCKDIQEAKQTIKEFKPNLAFLDISLREGDSYHLLNEIGNFNFELIFITAFDESSVRVLNYCHIPTLMKPIDIEQLKIEIEKSQLRLNSGYSFEQYQLTKYLFEKPTRILPVFILNHWELINTDDIDELKKVAGQTIIKLKSGKEILTPENISTIEKFIS
ncbi:MAG: response regulator [Bacteroidetes bacterium]|nr:response regulator [Bacteroidota bacterium]